MSQLNTTPTKNVDVFWAEISACDHCVQIYENDEVFFTALESFVSAGLILGEGIILIATAAHLKIIEARLLLSGHDIAAATSRAQYVVMDAGNAVEQFMVDGWPDETRFNHFVSALLDRVRKRYPKVRAFGEMVALMWANGQCGATIQLEHLWARLCQTEKFSLFCAYPRTGFTQDAQRSMMDVHLAHSIVFNSA